MKQVKLPDDIIRVLKNYESLTLKELAELTNRNELDLKSCLAAYINNQIGVRNLLKKRGCDYEFFLLTEVITDFPENIKKWVDRYYKWCNPRSMIK